VEKNRHLLPEPYETQAGTPGEQIVPCWVNALVAIAGDRPQTWNCYLCTQQVATCHLVQGCHGQWRSGCHDKQGIFHLVTLFAFRSVTMYAATACEFRGVDFDTSGP